MVHKVHFSSKTQKILSNIGNKIIDIPKEGIKAFKHIETTAIKTAGSVAHEAAGVVKNTEDKLFNPITMIAIGAVALVVLLRR